MIGSVNAAESKVSATADEGTFDPNHRIVRAISKRLDKELSKGDRECGADFVAIGTEIVSWRRHIHANPELGWALTATEAYVKEQLQRCGVIDSSGANFRDNFKREVAEQYISERRDSVPKWEQSEFQGGLVVDIKGNRDGPTVALRGEMDALPIREASGLSFASTATGRAYNRATGEPTEGPIAHACGHDAHTAIVMGAGLILKKMADAGKLQGNVRLIFQPAEEELLGAGPMIIEGAIDGVEAIFGLHSNSMRYLGQFATTGHNEPMLPGSMSIEYAISPGNKDAQAFVLKELEGLRDEAQGRQIERALKAKGASEEEILAARQPFADRGTLASISIPKDPDHVVAKFSYFEAEHLAYWERRTRSIADGCAKFGVKCTTSAPQIFVVPLVNKGEAINAALDALAEFTIIKKKPGSESIEFDVKKGDQQVSQLLRFDSNYETHNVFMTRGELGGSFNQVRGREGVIGYPSDDFSEFAARTKSSVFLTIGVHNKDKWGAGDRRLVHTAGFRMDETIIPIGSAVLAQSIVNYLNVRRQRSP
jgi:metal-dependent amidase/aminoacylase/carboxypeptidase family protein